MVIQFARRCACAVSRRYLANHLERARLVAGLLPYSGNIGRVHLVPCGHVLFNTRGHAGRFAAGQGGSGLGDAFFETIFLKFLLNKGQLVISSHVKL